MIWRVNYLCACFRSIWIQTHDKQHDIAHRIPSVPLALSALLELFRSTSSRSTWCKQDWTMCLGTQVWNHWTDFSQGTLSQSSKSCHRARAELCRWSDCLMHPAPEESVRMTPQDVVSKIWNGAQEPIVLKTKTTSIIIGIVFADELHAL